MKTSVRILFWEGLVLLVFAGLTLVFFSFQTVYELLFPFVFGGLGLIGLVAALIMFLVHWSSTKNERAAGPKGWNQTTRFGANAVLYTLIFFGIVVFLNIFSVAHPKKLDVTFAKVNTLSDQTATILKNLPANTELEIAGFFKAGEAKEFEKLAAKYQDLDPRVKTRVIDPDLHPEEVKRYTITQRGAVAVTCTTLADGKPVAGVDGRCTGQTNVTMDISEQGLTTAVMKVSAPAAGSVYFVQGHGEVPLDGAEERGYALIHKGLANENIVLKTYTPLTQGPIPADARLLVIAGPTKKLGADELGLFEQYLEKGGRLLVLLDPLTETGLEDLLAKYGVKVRNDVVVDRQVKLFEGSVMGFDAIVTTYGQHEITEKFGQNPTMFHLARSLDIDPKGAPGVMALPLLKTGEQSWDKTDLSIFKKEGAKPDFDGKTDLKGPLVLGAAIEKTLAAGDAKKTARLVVIGDADFVANRYAAQGYNADLFFNSINWLTGQEAYISIRPNTFAPDMFATTERDTALIFFASVFLLPQLIVMLGIGVAIRRRNS